MKLYKCDFCGKLMSTDQPRSVTKIFGLDACPECCRIADEIDLRTEYIRLVKAEVKNEQLSL